MKKLIPYIISILILIGGYFYFKNELEKDKASFEDEISKIESKYKAKTDSAYAIIDSVTALKNKSIVIAKEAVKAKEIAKSEARTYKNEYNKLVNEIPANQKDSLGNYINRDKVNKKIIAKQDEAIKQCDSAVTAYVKVIDRQNVIDENKDNSIDYEFENPNFNYIQFRSNLVFRWEYIPGSTLFVVWTQGNNFYEGTENPFESPILTDMTNNLFENTRLKQIAQEMGIRKLELAAEGGRIVFNETPNIDPMKLIQLVQKRPWEFKLNGQDKINFEYPESNVEQRIQWIKRFFNDIRPDASA